MHHVPSAGGCGLSKSSDPAGQCQMTAQQLSVAGARCLGEWVTHMNVCHFIMAESWLLNSSSFHLFTLNANIYIGQYILSILCFA